MRRLCCVTEFSTSSMTTAQPLTTQSRSVIVRDFFNPDNAGRLEQAVTVGLHF